jgi:RNA polymerase sigma-70 factor (ECF subfamily)
MIYQCDEAAGPLIYRKACYALCCCGSHMDASGTRTSEPFKSVYDANYRRVLQLLTRMVGPEEAADLAQTVFAKVAQALPNFRGDAELSTWLYRIALHVASDWLRSRPAHERRVTVRLPEDEDGKPSVLGAAVDDQHSPEDELARKQFADCIRAEIGKLPESHRSVLVLGELGGLSDDEVAATLGISRVNAKVRLHRARAQLRKQIQARCDFYQQELSCKPSSPSCCASPTSVEVGGSHKPGV